MHKISFSGGISFGDLPFVSALAEIQEAIEELAPEARLLDWLERFDADHQKAQEAASVAVQKCLDSLEQPR